MSRPILVELRDLGLSVAHRTLIRSVSLRVRAGELWCVLGPNGAGKTLLFHTMIGARAIQRGSIVLGGRALTEWAGTEAGRFRAFLPQVIHDAFALRVIDAVLVARHPHVSRWAWEGDGDYEKARAALEVVGMARAADRDITTLSGGERQRVAIAALFTQDVPLMLLDEPLAHLDVHHQILLMRHLRALAASAERGVMLSLHDVNLARRFATHAMLLREDAGVDVGPIDDVLSERALSLAYGYPIARVTAGDRVLFVAD